MQSHVRKEHMTSIEKKFNDLMVSVDFTMKQQSMDRLLKAIAVYILKGGYDATEKRDAHTE